MRRILYLILPLVLIITGCATATVGNNSSPISKNTANQPVKTSRSTTNQIPVSSQPQPTKLPASDFSNSKLQSVIPHNSKIARKLTFYDGNTAYAVIATSPTQNNMSGWIAVADWKTTDKQWKLDWITQPPGNSAPINFFLGPSEGKQQTVGALYADGADGSIWTAYVVGISPKKVTVLRNKTLEGGKISLKGNKIEIDGNNYQEFDFWNNGQWTAKVTPLTQLLKESNIQVEYVATEGYSQSQPVNSVSFIGSSTLRATVGETLSFIPQNSFAKQANANGEISIYIQDPENNTGPMLFNMADMLRNTTFKFTSPGTYTFYIPPYVTASPNSSEVAKVVVVVLK